MLIKLILTGAAMTLLGMPMIGGQARSDERDATKANRSEAAKPDDAKADGAKSFYDFTMKNIDGEDVPLKKYKGEVCLVVNVASKCGLTPQYKGLEALHRKYKDKGLRVIGFPANNFGSQEPGTEKQIKEFCTSKYDVTFDMMAKVSVMGDDQCGLYQFLTEHEDKDIAGPVVWNFQKYLVDREGNVVAKFDPRVTPEDEKLVKRVEELLGE